MRWTFTVFLALVFSTQTSPLIAHQGNVDPDTGCHIEKRTGKKHCHRDRIKQSKKQIEENLLDHDKHGKKKNSSAR